MVIDLSRFKVVYGERVLNAVAVDEIEFDFRTEEENPSNVLKPKFIVVIVINEDGNIEFIRDEAWRFQFIPNLDGRKGA